MPPVGALCPYTTTSRFGKLIIPYKISEKKIDKDISFPNTATERLFEFWRDNAPRNLVAPVPLSHWEVEYLADYYKRKY